MREMVGGCCVCSDDRGWPENPLVYCDGQSCTVAVHQACYGIVTVPTGPWYCRKCESQERAAKVKCELCPSKYGALKRTDNSGWAHVVCALYIPEVRFGNVTTMEPIQLQLIPQERFSKVCYICDEAGKPANSSVGACMQCNKSGCKQQFHVTCAQGLGLLCEEAGNYLDNVKYCGYCQHHYSKLKKGGNVKTIPPYKPVSTENHQSDSNSEKDADANLKAPTSTVGKRKSSSTTKPSTSASKASAKSSSYQKTVQNTTNNKPNDKNNKSNSSVKSFKNTTTDESVSAESEKTDKKDVETDKDKDIKEIGKGKKRKANSRTPTPSIISESIPPVPVSVVTTVNNSVSESVSTVISSAQKKETVTSPEIVDKPKKAKTEQATSPSVTPQTTSSALATLVKATTPSTTATATDPTNSITNPVITTPSIIQSTATSSPINSVVVSVPLVNTTLSPRSGANNQTSVVTAPTTTTPLTITQNSQLVSDSTPTNIHNGNTLTSTVISQTSSMLSSEMSGGGLKITYEKQAPPSSSLQAELERITAPVIEVPVKRSSRSQSTEKVEKPARSKKRNANGATAQATPIVTSKRSSRSQHTTSPPQPSSSFVNLGSNNQIKDSPPSSPSSESLGGPPVTRKSKGRKSAPASVSSSSSSNHNKVVVDTKENIKLFQNGIHAPHMLGNQLNPNSNMAQKMSDHLNSELEAHSIFNDSVVNSASLIGPQLHHRVIASARSSSAGGSSTASGGSGLSSMLGGGGGVIPQTLDQLLERQWEQGSQFLMEQAQHFDIASLLSCLHQLRAENLRLEEHVSSLLQRRDHLLAVNARLAIPLTGPPATPQSSHPHTVNNIHPTVAASHAEAPRSRHSGNYPPHAQGASQHPSGSLENGLPGDQGYPPHPHRSPAGQPQPSPTVRESSSGYSSGLLRQSADSSGRSAPRPHGYPMYPGPSSSQQQMVIRRDPDVHHQSSSKPS